MPKSKSKSKSKKSKTDNNLEPDAMSKRSARAEPAPLPATREALLVLHREARRRRDAAPLLSEDRAEMAAEIARIEVEIARIERAMDPPRG